MGKAAIRHGDPTTTGGFVMAFSSTIHDDGRKLALHGDEATCGHCNGTHRIFGSGKGMSELGRDVVVDGDPVLCPCGKNRVVIGANPGIFLNSSSDPTHATALRTASDTNPNPPIFAFDERVRAITTGVSIDGYPYCVEMADGRIQTGRLDASGKLPRIDTGETAGSYVVYWGDEALARRAGR